MRLEIKQLENIDKGMVIAVLILVVGIALSGWMFMDLSAREKAVGVLAAEVASKKKQVEALPPSSERANSGNPETAERFNRIVISPDALSGITEQIGGVAAKNHCESVTVSPELTQLTDTTPGLEGKMLPLLGVKQSITITVSFKADYENTARFLGELSKLPQMLIMKTVSLQRSGQKLDTTVAVQIYQKGT